MVGAVGSLFVGIGIIIIVAAFAGYVLRLLRQPQLLAYIIVGILLSAFSDKLPHVLSSVIDVTVIESMSLIGIAFLLFIVGLEMDLKALKNVALVSTLGGGIQILIVFVLGYLVALIMGFLTLEAAYLGLIFAFSSTMVVMKLLSDKRELTTLHGRLAVGILLMQDIVAIFALSVLSSLNEFSWVVFGFALLKFVGMFIVAYILSKFVFPYIFKFAAKNQELLLVSSLAVCFIFSLAFHYFGFSVAIGAFIAGVALGNLNYSIEIIGKMKSLKDFFALLFFVALGMAIDITVLKNMWVQVIVLLLLVMIVKPFIIMIITSLFRFTKKPSFMTANALAQIGEFSLIVVTQGIIFGHISQELFSLTVIVTILSITLTSYYIEYNQFFYKILQKPLKIFDVFSTENLEFMPTDVKPKIVLCGHNRIGYSILRDLHKMKKKILIVDYNPEVIAKMVKEGYHCIYGDIADEEVVDRMNLKEVKMVISTVPEIKSSMYLIKKVREVNHKAKILVTANDVDDALHFYERGADYVILPHFLGGEHVSALIQAVRERKKSLHKEKKHHINHLKKRKKLGHDEATHPHAA